MPVIRSAGANPFGPAELGPTTPSDGAATASADSEPASTTALTNTDIGRLIAAFHT
jgi:hypothetical protein